MTAISPTAGRTEIPFGAIVATVILMCGLAVCSLPVVASMVTVFLFAGPHNLLEVRYLLSKMPRRWGKMRPFFLTGIIGVAALTVSQIVISIGLRQGSVQADHVGRWLAIWNTLLIFWCATLILLCPRQRSQKRRIDFVLPMALIACSVNWVAPAGWSLVIIYLHPIIALYFVVSELKRRRPEWVPVFRNCLLLIPVCIFGIVWTLAGVDDLPGDDLLTMQIAQHAGSDIIPSVSSQLLVTVHVFLELLHYLAWVVAIPAITFGFRPWILSDVPLAKRSRWFYRGIVILLAMGILILIGLWAGFLIEYPLTRDIYFTVALAHVLVEFHYLIWLR